MRKITINRIALHSFSIVISPILFWIMWWGDGRMDYPKWYFYNVILGNMFYEDEY